MHTWQITFIRQVTSTLPCIGSFWGSGEFGPLIIGLSGIFGEFGLLTGEYGPQLEYSAN